MLLQYGLWTSDDNKLNINEKNDMNAIFFQNEFGPNDNFLEFGGGKILQYSTVKNLRVDCNLNLDKYINPT